MYRSSYYGKHIIRIVCVLHFVHSLHARACVRAYSSYAYACVIVLLLDHMGRHAHRRYCLYMYKYLNM